MDCKGEEHPQTCGLLVTAAVGSSVSEIVRSACERTGFRSVVPRVTRSQNQWHHQLLPNLAQPNLASLLHSCYSTLYSPPSKNPDEKLRKPNRKSRRRGNLQWSLWLSSSAQCFLYVSFSFVNQYPSFSYLISVNVYNQDKCTPVTSCDSAGMKDDMTRKSELHSHQTSG